MGSTGFIVPHFGLKQTFQGSVMGAENCTNLGHSCNFRFLIRRKQGAQCGNSWNRLCQTHNHYSGSLVQLPQSATITSRHSPNLTFWGLSTNSSLLRVGSRQDCSSHHHLIFGFASDSICQTQPKCCLLCPGGFPPGDWFSEKAPALSNPSSWKLAISKSAFSFNFGGMSNVNKYNVEKITVRGTAVCSESV